MSWFPAVLARSAARPDEQRSWQLVPFFKGLVELPLDTLLASWAGAPYLEDSRYGRVVGRAAFVDYVAASRDWLLGRRATAHLVARVTRAARSVEEVVLHTEAAGERQTHGSAVVAEWDDEHRLTAVRVHHGGWPLPGHRVGSPGTAAPEAGLLPAVVGEVIRAREAGDLDAVLDCYEDDAELCLFDAVPQVLSGRNRLRRLYAEPDVLGGGGAWTTVGPVTVEGRLCAVEYQAGRAGTTEPDEVGVATYACGPDGRIAQERRYRVHERCEGPEAGRG